MTELRLLAERTVKKRVTTVTEHGVVERVFSDGSRSSSIDIDHEQSGGFLPAAFEVGRFLVDDIGATALIFSWRALLWGLGVALYVPFMAARVVDNVGRRMGAGPRQLPQVRAYLYGERIQTTMRALPGGGNKQLEAGD